MKNYHKITIITESQEGEDDKKFLNTIVDVAMKATNGVIIHNSLYNDDGELGEQGEAIHNNFPTSQQSI